MCIDTSISCRSCQRLIVLVRDVLARFRVSIPFGEAEINYVDNVLFLAVANKEVVWLHVPVNEVVVVQEFETLNHLISDHERRLNREFALAKIEGVL